MYCIPRISIGRLFAERLGRVIVALCAGMAVLMAVTVGAEDAAPGLRASWPEFRGPWHNGLTAAPGDTKPRDLPLTWSENEHVVWKTAIAPQGWSSPVVLDGQIWLTTATTDGHDFFVVCVDAGTGAILHNEKLFHSDNPEPLGNEVNCYASPTCAIEPGRVYVHFGSYGTACLDTASCKVIWERQDMPCRHYRGPGSSVIVFENLLILTFDGADVQYVTALDKRTGKTVWKTDRTTAWQDLDENGQAKREGDFRKGFTTPAIVEAGAVPLLISPSSWSAYAYEARTGKEVWKTHYAGYSPSPRPVVGDGLVYFMTGRVTPELWAIRPDGHGDVTDTHVAWKVAGHIVPEEPSPLLVDDLLYVASNDGIATCLEAATGIQVWSERLGGNYMASPIYADGRVYFFSTQGKTSVIKAGRVYEVIATNKLESGFMASAAIVDKAFILRTKTHLYRIESAASDVPIGAVKP